MEAILTTKLYIPSVHPNRISRAHLIAKLDEDLWQIRGKRFLRRLTLIAAPAGYGKSTLVCEWVGHLEIPVAWISFDESDNDPGRFLQYLVASIGTIQPGFGEAFAAMLRSGQYAITGEMAANIMSALVNEIAAIPHPFLLVLDDYHTLQSQGIHMAVKLLLDHLPENLSLVIATRADPPLSLSRLRVRRQMAEVRSSDLRFSESEADRFLRQVMQLDLGDPEVQTLMECTEGWIAGLQMAALALQGRVNTEDFIHHFSGRERFVIDYLFEEVLSRLPDDIQTFLVQTSILERMTGSLCDAVLNSPPQTGQQTLEYLDRANLFLVPLDDERCYYRYHHLFADLLRHRLSSTSPQLVPVLHARAAEWFEQQGHAADAFDHWIAARNFRRAADLIIQNGYKPFVHGNFQQLHTWLQQIPKDLVHSEPWLCIFYSWVLIFIGRFAEAETYLVSAEKNLTPILETADRAAIEPYGHVAAVRVYLSSRGQEAESIIHYADLAFRYVAEEDRSIRSLVSFFLGTGRIRSNQYDLACEAYAEAARLGKEAGNVLVAVNALCTLAELTRGQGKLHEAFKIYQEALNLATDERGQPIPVAAEPFVGRSRLFYQWDDFPSTEADLRSVEKIIKLYPNYDLKVDYNLRLANLRFAQGDLAAAEQLILELEQSGRQAFYRAEAALLAYQIRLHIAKGSPERALQLAEQHDWRLENKCLFAWADPLIAYSRALIALNDFQRADRLLNECRSLLETYGLWTYVIKALIVQAQVLALQGEYARAQEQMLRALSLAEPEGFIRIFLDEGETIQPLLARCRSMLARQTNGTGEAHLTAYVDRLLAALTGKPAEKTEKPLVREVPCPGLAEPLTERELEVLQLIAAGFSNKEIADKLVVTIGTVKSHTSNIYRKLDAVGRTQALAKAREFRLL